MYYVTSLSITGKGLIPYGSEDKRHATHTTSDYNTLPYNTYTCACKGRLNNFGGSITFFTLIPNGGFPPKHNWWPAVTRSRPNIGGRWSCPFAHQKIIAVSGDALTLKRGRPFEYEPVFPFVFQEHILLNSQDSCIIKYSSIVFA